jgi:hypothetical protein
LRQRQQGSEVVDPEFHVHASIETTLRLPQGRLQGLDTKNFNC